jgi:uncharacterized protein (DUF2132 family)
MADQPPKDDEDVRDETGHLVRELHGVTLAKILMYLVLRVGFAGLAERIPIKCFTKDPSIASSLTFLRRTPWARKRVEALYIEMRTEEVRGRPPVPGTRAATDD